MSHDVATGIIEMVQDHFTEDSEGTYTVQIQDGKGKNQSTLVLIGDGNISWFVVVLQQFWPFDLVLSCWSFVFYLFSRIIAFKAALAEADFQRREYIRVKEGTAESGEFLNHTKTAQLRAQTIAVDSNPGYNTEKNKNK